MDSDSTPTKKLNKSFEDEKNSDKRYGGMRKKSETTEVHIQNNRIEKTEMKKDEKKKKPNMFLETWKSPNR